MNLKKCLINNPYSYQKIVRPTDTEYKKLIIVEKNRSLVDTSVFSNMMFRDTQILLVSSQKKIDPSFLTTFEEIIYVGKKNFKEDFYYIDSSAILLNYSNKYNKLSKEKFFAWQVCEKILSRREDIK